MTIPSDLPGQHRENPLNPDQGFLTPGWGNVTPFVVQSRSQFRAPPPALTSPSYTEAYNEVKRLGGDGLSTPDEMRSACYQLLIGVSLGLAQPKGSPPA
jgi:hypothetical protein